MKTLDVGEPRLRHAGTHFEISAAVSGPGAWWLRDGARLRFEVPVDAPPPAVQGDPFAVAVLLPAMAAGVNIRLHAPLSRSMMATLNRVQEQLVGWNPINPWARFRKVAIMPDGFIDVDEGPDCSALFFTGGVDSMYSLTRSAAETGNPIDVLVFVHGFDVPLDAPQLATSVEARVRSAADAAGKPLVVLRTNLREITDPVVTWEMMHGAALASVGHLMGHTAQRWMISSADAYLTSTPYGTAAALDPLWSRDGLAFMSVGGRVDRLSKLQALVDSPIARQHLIVCWQDRHDADNCGRCPKCVRTILQLLVLGALDSFATLPRSVDSAAIDALPAEPAHRSFVWTDLWQRLQGRPEWRPIAEGVARMIDRTRLAARGPRPRDLLTGEGRRVAIEWLRRRLRPHVPAVVRRRVVAIRRSRPHRGDQVGP